MAKVRAANKKPRVARVGSIQAKSTATVVGYPRRKAGAGAKPSKSLTIEDLGLDVDDIELMNAVSLSSAQAIVKATVGVSK
ncbi:hypothetical protein FEM03_19975 [Phragmitibacter flavus]|uniref:Uncharacterized protein n=1 Tax=Phragmitibacter flavus TaxID=2576071 RepID=A0A5R8K9G9_9BACT|nr:hypothetical protein [Phragmitibacter flavus]TLD68941.1 hypothetical protein FEM03_19975 [Phragmitibacter flavus]